MTPRRRLSKILVDEEKSGSPTEGRVRLLTAEQAAEEDRIYWRSKTPAERLAAAEQLRQIAYGYDPTTARIQAIAQLVELERR